MPEIEFFYAAHSAFAYLGMARLIDIAKESGAEIIHRPMNLGLVVRGAYPEGVTQRTKANRNYFFGREIERWAQYRGVPIGRGIPANHRNDVTLANSLLVAAARHGERVNELALAIMGAHWLDQADLADEASLADIVGKQGLNAAALLEAAKSKEALMAYEANTREAIERSVFGSPTFFVGGDMFFGQDHLELVEMALKKPFRNSWEHT